MKKSIRINPTSFGRDQLKFYTILLPVVAFMLLPLLYVVFHAFKPMDELFAFPPKFITTRPTLENLRRLFAVAGSSNYPLSLYLFHSVFTSLLTMGASVLMCGASGFALSKKQFKGKKLILEINQAALMFVPTAMTITRFLIIKEVGLMDSYLAHIIPLLAMPVGLFLVKQFIDQVPSALVDAAQIDGCSDYGILFRIILPVIRPALATVSILAFQASWNSAEASQRYIDSEHIKTFAYYISVVAPSGNNVAGRGMAAGGVLLLFIPCLLLFIIMQSKVMNTVAHSGIK
jgi:multiple sugar transport system permease protein